MEIKKIDARNFNRESLLGFRRHQTVTEVYRLIDGRMELVSNPFEEDWTVGRRLEKAEEILSGRFIVFGAFDGERVIGEIMLVPEMNEGRLIADSFHVSEDYRRRGVGRALFEEAKREAVWRGARALYVSACPARETVDFYRAMGCRVSENPIKAYAEDEPCDIQMECPL